MNISPDPAAPPGRVLFADDDEQFRMGLGKRLQRAGFECDFAGTAAEALEQLKTKEYDVMLSDINMPGNVNLELISNLPVVMEGLPILLLTGNPSVETASRSVRLRVMAYLTKPPDFDDLCGLLRSGVEESRSARVLKNSRRRLQDWDREIEHIQALLQRTAAPERQSAMQSYLRLNLRNLVVGLVELEHLLIHEGGRLGTDQATEHQTLLNALRKTIATLEKTKDHFKSKDLGELRKELESLVNHRPAK